MIITCPQCNQNYQVAGPGVVQRVKCKKCGAAFQVGNPAAKAPAPSTAADQGVPLVDMPLVPAELIDDPPVEHFAEYAPRKRRSAPAKKVPTKAIALSSAGVLILCGLTWFAYSASQRRGSNASTGPVGADRRWDNFKVMNAKIVHGKLHLSKQGSITTEEVFSGPLDITITARTNSTNIRLHAYGGGLVIWNWELNPRELRVHRPSGGIATAKVDPLEAHRWYKLRWVVEDGQALIYVDDKLVFQEAAAEYVFSSAPVTVTPAFGSEVEIESFVVKPTRPVAAGSLAKQPPPPQRMAKVVPPRADVAPRRRAAKVTSKPNSTPREPTPERITIVAPRRDKQAPPDPNGSGRMQHASDPPFHVNGAIGRPADESQMICGGYDGYYAEAGPPGSLLAGLEFGLMREGDIDIIVTVRPIFRAGELGELVLGTQHGSIIEETVRVVARDGYAVGTLRGNWGLHSQGLGIVFMRIAGDQLDPEDSYEGAWVGRPRPEADHQLLQVTGRGRPVVGIVGSEHGQPLRNTGLGLLFAWNGSADGAREARIVERPKKPATETRVNAGPDYFRYREVGPPGSILVGFEFGVNQEGNREVVRAVIPVFRDGEQEIPGQQRGVATGKWYREVARPGYAVGQLNIKGAFSVDGIWLTYLRVNGNRLKASDTYDGPVIGVQNDNALTTLSSGGRTVVGVVGSTIDTRSVGLGLIFDPLSPAGGAAR